MTQRRAPVTRGIAPQGPPILPPNSAGTSPRSIWDLTLQNNDNGTITNLRVVRQIQGQVDPTNGQPMFQEASAPALVDTLNTDTAPGDQINYSDTPPEQGKTVVAIDFSHGLTQDPLGFYKIGNYGWGENIWTVDTGGLVLRAPALTALGYATGTDPLDHRVECTTVHNFVDGASVSHSTTWFAAGTKVYYLDENDNLRITKSPTQPSGSFRITDIISWQGILVVAHDTVNPYEWSTDSGTTWHTAGIGAPGTVTAALQAGGSLTNATDYYAMVTAIDQFGNESAPTASTPAFLTAGGGNNTVRLAFDAVPEAVAYRIYVSNDTTPHFVGHITETQRGTGIVITAQDTTGAGGVAGAVDVQVAGTGGLTTSIVNGGALTNATTYHIKASAVDGSGAVLLTLLGADILTATPALAARIILPQISGAASWQIFLSTDADPKFVGAITEAQRVAGVVITGQNTSASGGVAGAVDVQVAGTGAVATTVPISLSPAVTETSQQRYGKFFATFQEAQLFSNPARPILVMSNDPNEVYSTEDPTNASQWNTGSIVGQGGSANPDHNTSLHVTPTSELLVGKALNLYQLEQAVDATEQAGASVTGDVALRMGRIAQSTDAGEENFAFPASMGFATYYVVRDYDIAEVKPRRLSSNSFTMVLTAEPGFGPAMQLPAVQQAQRPIQSLASDNVSLLFAALGGTEGYVLVGRYGKGQPGAGATEGAWEWHGAICRADYAIRFLWCNSFPDASDTTLKDTHLFVAGNDSPYTISVMRIPRTNILYATDITAATTGFMQMGKDYAGQAQVQKVLSRATPRTRNLNAPATPGPAVTISYRVVEGAGFTDLGTFDASPLPLPADLVNTYLPAGVHGTYAEFKATLTGDTSVMSALESIEYVLFRRPIRKALITATAYADNAGMTREGGRRTASWSQLRSELLACRNAIQPPTLYDRETGVKWTVDLQQFQRRWMLDNDGSGATMVVDLVMQELDSSIAPASAITEASTGPPPNFFHSHTMETFAAPGASVTLALLPVLEPQVYLGRYLLAEGVDYTWTLGSRTITFTTPATDTVRVWYEYL